MKTAIRLIGVVLLFALMPAAEAATASTSLRVEGMTCAGCATAVKLVLQKTPGVISAKVSYEEKLAVVSYDTTATTPAAIAAAVADALAYTVTVVEKSGAATGADQRACLNPTVFAGKVAGLLGQKKDGV